MALAVTILRYIEGVCEASECAVEDVVRDIWVIGAGRSFCNGAFAAIDEVCHRLSAMGV